MAEVIWTLQAVDDVEAIADFIARDSPHYASLFVMDVLSVAETLAQWPLSGRVVPETNRVELRERILGNYRIIYRASATLVEILTVYHGMRLLDPSALK